MSCKKSEQSHASAYEGEKFIFSDVGVELEGEG